EGIPLKAVLKKLSKEAKIDFAYVSNSIPTDRKISIEATEEELDQVLKKILVPLGMDYRISEGVVLIEKLPVQQNKQSESKIIITGKVTSVKGEPLPGVSVKLKGGTAGTSTDAQ